MPSYPIQLERISTKADPWVDSSDEWEVIAEPFATVQPMTGRELINAQQTDAQHTHKIRFRWGPSLSDLSTADRLKFRGRTLELTSVVNVGERNEWFECLGVESTVATNG